MQTLEAKYVSGGKFIAACCPFCIGAGKTPDTKFHLYIKKGAFAYCYRCGYKNSYERFSKIFSLNIARGLALTPSVVIGTTDTFKEHLAKNTTIWSGDSAYVKGALGYLKKRKITGDIARRMCISLGKDDLFGRVVFVDLGNNYYLARSFLNVEPKTLNPPNSVRPLMYFSREITGVVYLVEGTFDMVPFLKTNRQVFALLGKDISNHQLSQLATLAVHSVVISLDGDAFGAAKKLAKAISAKIPMVNVGVVMYDDKTAKDPSEYDVELFERSSIYWVRRMNDEEVEWGKKAHKE